jgi:phosphate transport system substrate-binding protein
VEFVFYTVFGEFIVGTKKIISDQMSKYLLLILLLVFVACKEKQAKYVMADTPTTGSIKISVDETFRPVISEQLKVFMSIHPEAKITAEYKAEADCLRDLQNDSTRMIIISRALTTEEEQYYKRKLEYILPVDKIAYDAIAVVVNNTSVDSVFSTAEIAGMLSGTDGKNTNVVVDGKTATSTVRYLIDSVLKGAPLGKNVTAAQNSEGVLNYVSSNPGSVGFVGVSWLGNPEDERQQEYLKKVKMALIECKKCEAGTYAKPSQQTITFKQYPLVRGLYYVLKENQTGLGTGLLNFLSQERGQLIFKRAYLVPAKMQLYRRSTSIKESE